MKHGKYELGRTLGEGNFGKVKFARRVDTGEPFAVKILDRKRILDLKIHEQIKREIATLKLLKHPNVVRLHEVSASKTRIYMVLEYINGGELFDKMAMGGRLSEEVGRKIFQQLIDGISYCHDRGVYHRDLMLENVLMDATGNIKISDFELSALSQHRGNDGLMHTTCGSFSYIAPEVLANRGYDGAMSDIWSCGVILYIILTGALPFEDRNLAVLYQKIIKGDTQIPKCLSIGAQNMLRRILDPNPRTRIDAAQIKDDAWFKKDYTPAVPHVDDNTYPEDETLSLMSNGADESGNEPTLINAFELIGMSSCLDLSGFFEKEDITERKIRFTSNFSPKNLFDKIDEIVAELGFQVQSANPKLQSMVLRKTRVYTASSCRSRPSSLSIAAEVFELSPTLYVVELRKAYGDSSLYRELCSKISNDLGLFKSESLSNTPLLS